MNSTYTIEDQRLMTPAKTISPGNAVSLSHELGRRVVEIGCGIGNFTGMLLDGRAVMALDAEPLCVEQLKARYRAAANLEVINFDWAAGGWEQRLRPRLAAFRPDSCVCLNVLEHIEDDREALLRMAAILNLAGSSCCSCPRFPRYMAPSTSNWDIIAATLANPYGSWPPPLACRSKERIT